MKKILPFFALSLHLAFCASTQNKAARNTEKDPQYQYEKAEEEYKKAYAIDGNPNASFIILGDVPLGATL